MRIDVLDVLGAWHPRGAGEVQGEVLDAQFLFFVLASGYALAWAQMMRGARFLSHFMWTAWICWSIGAPSWHILRAWRDASGLVGGEALCFIESNEARC